MQNFELRMGLKLSPLLCPINNIVRITFMNTNICTLFTLGVSIQNNALTLVKGLVFP